MGNKIARTTQASATEYYLHDLPSSYNLVLKEVLGRGRFLKSIQCKHDEGLVIVKVYFKRGDQIDLRDYERRLFRIREIFRSLDHPHVWPFQFWLETDKAAYLLRQYFFNNLHDRLSTRPFLSLVEKKWLAFQLLYAAKQSHDHGICHGDIKCENVLVTSWNWVYLADFASFKPTYIPDDDPSDFSFFFDTGGRRLCYLAPERFYEHASDMPVAPDAPLKPSMDIFSVGCVIAELFLEGQPLFELSQLLAYRRGQYDPSLNLEKIPDPGLRKMILHMIQLDPESRLSAEGYLQMPEFGGSGRDSGAGICHNPTTIPPNITPEEAAWLKSYYPEAKDEGESERKKHAIAVAAATAAAADAAVAAAHAAVEVVRLTSRGRKQSSINNNLFVGEGGFDGIASWAAVRIQTNFRAYLARKALRALKGLVKIQALVRGYLVRKQATATLHGMQALIRAQATIRSKRVLIGSHQPDHDSPTWARPSMVDAFGAPSSAAESRRLSASFEARTLNPPIDHDTPKVVEVDIGHPGSRSARKGPRTRTSFSELGDDPSSYQILPPQFQFDHFQSHPQLAPARISIPNHSHQCCHHFNNSEWGLTEECRSTTSQNTPRFSSCGAEPVGPTPPLTPTRAGAGAAIFHHGGWGRQQLYYYNYPSYMAKTMSFKAKVRSQSAPKQRPEGNVTGNCMSSNSNIKKRMTLSEMMDARNSLSGVRMQRSCSQVQEAINFKNAVMGKLGRSPF